MNIVEQALLFTCAGEELQAIIAWPQAVHSASAQAAVSCGVLIVVGGPQYRVGSHRQFLLLSRRLASAGYPTMRFDHRGMGDAGGSMRGFEELSTDIAAAIEAFQRSCPTVQRIVLWGLCDAASAALLYVEASHDPRIAGLALLNPWVRSEVSLAQTHIKHYYGQRLLQGEFWRKLLSGRMEVMKSLASLLASARLARRSRAPGEASEKRRFQDRMAAGWRKFPGELLLILSGQDYTAKEFIEFSAADPAWSGLADAAKVRRVDLADADHTFSSREQRAEVEDATLAWLDNHLKGFVEAGPQTARDFSDAHANE
jgi:exosortase A-associated hydrolase 1